ncbi:hypothetical protein [Paraburkholderia sediminicola]|uniref:hypothetical protein n=1 Tax=Paraburkholderia sediminicola TaxID=458836 RepID=UPI0038BBE7BE
MNRQSVEISSANLGAALLRLSGKTASIFPFQSLSEGRHFFRIITNYFSGAIDYFPACSTVSAKRTGCRPSTDKKADAHVRLTHLFGLIHVPFGPAGVHLPAHV